MRRRPEPAGRTRILMDKLIIEGGTPLKGTIDISGSKNAALPILFAGILLDAPMVYTNVPDLRDIHTTIKLLNVLGCSCSYDDHRVELKPGSLLPEAPYDLVRTMRASVLCLGPLLARIGQARVALPGGCAIGARPVDQHLKGLELMGATFELEEGYIMGHCDKLRGAHITFDMPTVGGTENLLMAAALADGHRAEGAVAGVGVRAQDHFAAARHGLGAQTHRAAQAVLRTVVPHHREAEFLCQRRGGIVLRHHRHLREFLRRHRLQRTAQQTFSVHHSLQLIAPEAAAAARRHDQAADPQLRHANHPLSCVPVYQLQYAPSSFAVSLFRK